MYRMPFLGGLAILVLLASGCSPAGRAAHAVVEPGVTAGAADTLAPLAPEQVRLLASLKSQGAAPELFNRVWLNSPPLRLADLRGKVIVIDFWTFDCINCIHVIPSVREWYNKYKDASLVVIGVHSPEFDYEHDLHNVNDAIARLNVPYPVAIDNDFATWQAYRNRYWPALYFVDKAGRIRHVHIGEGD